MPRAERGTIKDVANRMKSKGLQRLRWYCQVCEKQCRDENGFKCHTQSEAHVRQMMIVGENPMRHMQDYSRQFQHDFIELLRTAHGEKRVHVNNFYAGEYITNKQHIHMNGTRWASLTEFVKYLGREGICRVDFDEEKGWFISWIDSSPEALRRKDAVTRRERADRGDEERTRRLLQEQVERATKDAGKDAESVPAPSSELVRPEGQKLSLSLKKLTPAPAQNQAKDAPRRFNPLSSKGKGIST